MDAISVTVWFVALSFQNGPLVRMAPRYYDQQACLVAAAELQRQVPGRTTTTCVAEQTLKVPLPPDLVEKLKRAEEAPKPAQ